MSNFSKNEDFHIPFIKELVFVGLVTIVSMISIRYFLFSTLSHAPHTPIIDYTQSPIKPE
jgi:hypothetical protein